MKQLFILFLGSSLLYACNANDTNNTEATTTATNNTQVLSTGTDSANYTSIQWLDSAHQDLGKIAEGQVVEISWKFKNTGNKPLIITNASASCGCTVAERPEEPVAPGGEGVIKAKFDSKDRVGPQRKEVYVEANTSGSRSSHLSFAVEVAKK